MEKAVKDLPDVELRFRLEEEEYREFIQWFSHRFHSRRMGKHIRPDDLNLKEETREETRIQVEQDGIHIWSGKRDLKLLYPALTKMDMTGNLIVFFAEKEFWAVPRRVFGDEELCLLWFQHLAERRISETSARMPLRDMQMQSAGEGNFCCCYTRTVDQVMEAYQDLGSRTEDMERLREQSIFPYRYTGIQLFAMKGDGIYEYGERSVSRHQYEDLSRAEYTDIYLYLTKVNGEKIMLPLDCLGGVKGMERLVSICNESRPADLPKLHAMTIGVSEAGEKRRRRMGRQQAPDDGKVIALHPYMRPGKCLKVRSSGGRAHVNKKKHPDFCRVGNPISGYILIGAAALITLAIAIWGPQMADSLRAEGKLDFLYGNGMYIGSAGYAQMISAIERESGKWEEEYSKKAETYSDMDNSWKEHYMVTVPDDTVFDRVGDDGTYVSSGQFFTMKLPPGDWENAGFSEYDDILRSSWGSITVRGFRDAKIPYGMAGTRTPKTKEEYLERMRGTWADSSILPEVVDYSYEDDGGCVIVRKEQRLDNGEGGYSLELSLMSPEYFYTVSIGLLEEAQDMESPRLPGFGKRVEEARAILDTFRIVDTSTGICRQMEEAVFHGYYGKNTVMTSCLVLMEREMDDDEIGECLEQVKAIDSGFFGSRDGEALAARREGCSWLGIDSPSLQQNCYEENAKKVSEIFQSEVILYDEFDGDLLMVAYCSKDQKHCYERATSFDRTVLEEEFQCYGKGQKFPEDLLQYMDLSKEEAVAVWEDKDAVFQMEKWEEITAHMTKMPVPREFIGWWDYDAFKDGFEVVRR